MTKQFDLIEDAILQAYQTNKNKRRRVQIKTDQFGKITLLEVFIGNIKSGDFEHRVRIFWQGDEVRETWGYNLEAKDRHPIIVKMLFEGFTQVRIAQMLRVHPSTVHKDVRYLREKTTLLAGYEFRPTVRAVQAPARGARTEHRMVH